MSINVAEFVETCLIPYREGWGYILGGSGKVWTEAQQKKVENDPDGNAMTKQYGRKWIGKRVIDCSGIPYWAAKQFGVNIPHGSNSQWDRSVTNRCHLSGGKRTDGAVLKYGSGVFKTRDDDQYHEGVYIGEGKVVEAKGTKYGVVLSDVTEWDDTGEFTFVDYVAEGKEGTVKAMMAKVVCDSGSCVKMRASPKETERLWDEIACGSEVEVLEKAYQWCKIRALGKTGYMMTKFLQFDDDEPPEEAADAPDTGRDDAQCIRVELSTESAVVLRDFLQDIVDQIDEQAGRG